MSANRIDVLGIPIDFLDMHSVVARIVEAHAGRIDVVNRPTGGAVFSLTLPRFQQAN